MHLVYSNNGFYIVSCYWLRLFYKNFWTTEIGQYLYALEIIRYAVLSAVNCFREAKAIEKSYLSEAGGRVTIEAWLGHQKLMQMMCPLLSVTVSRQITTERLILDLYYLLLGVSSETFTYNEVDLLSYYLM